MAIMLRSTAAWLKDYAGMLSSQLVKFKGHIQGL